MVETLDEATRTARLSHRCTHCRRDIAKDVLPGSQTNKDDGIYTLRWHLCFEERAAACRPVPSRCHHQEGWQGLREEGRAKDEDFSACDARRGAFPHIIARMALTFQLREATP